MDTEEILITYKKILWWEWLGPEWWSKFHYWKTLMIEDLQGFDIDVILNVILY